jgi:hypothetical protein
MVSLYELLRVILAPVIVSAVVAGIGRWRRWAWAMPLAVGAGFLTGYALLGVPKLPPRDGTDWLFWLAIPATLLGIIDATVGGRWGWVLGAAAGGVMCVIAWPLVPHTVPRDGLWVTVAIAGQCVLVCFTAWYVQPRVPPGAIVATLCLTLAAGAVVIMSSNLRIVGLYGIAAAAAVGPLVLLVGREGHAPRSVAVVCVCLLAGLLAGGVFYPDPPVSGRNVAVLCSAPVLMVIGSMAPGRRRWVAGVIAILAVGLAVTSVAVPAAREAQRAVEAQDDANPYAGYE